MKRVEDMLWVWLRADQQDRGTGKEWRRQGGKWIVFDTRERIELLAERLGPYIDSGEIKGAKYWKGDPSAINVYSLDWEKERVLEILVNLGASRSRVWEYDYAWDRNLQAPFSFVYSWCSKFSTILPSYGVIGSLRLARDAIRLRNGDDD